ncbi:MAG: MCE family protein [Desulfatitalea sp.]|nr:MCE family protein [Desulfatitalea sp.]NNJ99435.1 MCE family protein [Desulfatitalea sp.]
MEMEFSKLERLVGAFIVGVIILLIATFVIIGRGKDWFETYITYYTTFDETYNLQENAAIKLFRADIGKVKQVTLEKNHVRLKLAIQEKYASRIREDTVAQVESPTLIGSEYIAIVPGTADAPTIAAGGEIPSREKRSIADILDEFEVEKTALMVIKALQEISKFAEYLNDPEGPLLISLNNLEATSGDVRKISNDLKAGKGPAGLLLESEDLLQQIVDIIARLDHVMENIDAATAKAPHAMDLVQENLTTYRDTGHALQARVEQARIAMEDIKRASADLQTIMVNIKSGSQRVPEITITFQEGIDEIRRGVEQVNRVVQSLQRSVLIRGNLPLESTPGQTDAGARP